MIIGTHKQQVIHNIKTACEEGTYNRKVEVDDPVLPVKAQQDLIRKYQKVRRFPLGYGLCNVIARSVVDQASYAINRTTRYEGLEQIRKIKGGAILTSNHFNPLDNTAVRMAAKKVGKRRLYIVSQITNLAMRGWVGFLMRFIDCIPICAKNRTYMTGAFEQRLEQLLQKRQWILIYPEEEMWFNYKKPRPPKRGAYYYAAKYHVPVLSFFVEMKETNEKDSEEFYKTQYVVHVLPPIYPDASLTRREDSKRMMKLDYEQKKACYERVYQKTLTYDFSYEDIAGYCGNDKGKIT